MFNFDKLFNSNTDNNEDLFNTLYENENSINSDDASFIETVMLAAASISDVVGFTPKAFETAAEAQAYCDSSGVVGKTFYSDDVDGLTNYFGEGTLMQVSKCEVYQANSGYYTERLQGTVKG